MEDSRKRAGGALELNQTQHPSFCLITSRNSAGMRCLNQLNGRHIYALDHNSHLDRSLASRLHRPLWRRSNSSPARNCRCHPDHSTASGQTRPLNESPSRIAPGVGQPNAPPFTGVPLKRELLKSKELIRVLRSANSPNRNYTARQVARRSTARLR
jgi:hypothetical protein